MSRDEMPTLRRQQTDADRDLKAKIRQLADQERSRIREEERVAAAMSFDSGSNTAPVELIERASMDPDGPPRNRDILELHERVAKRVKSDTANKIEGRLSKVEVPVRIMWALFIFCASIAGASMFTAVSYIRTSAGDSARGEYRLQSVEQAVKSVGPALLDVTNRLRDIEETARLLGKLFDEYLQQQRRGPTNPRNK